MSTMISRLVVRTALLAAVVAGTGAMHGCIIVVGNRSQAYDYSAYRTVDGRHRRIGVELDSTSAALAAQTGTTPERSCTIRRVIPGTPAERAGLRAYDVITGIDGADDASISALRQAVTGRKPTETVTLRVVRAGQPMEICVPVEEVTVSEFVVPTTEPSSTPDSQR
jgi:S1-C subfamily serine protease